jgi:hypothetical protein
MPVSFLSAEQRSRYGVFNAVPDVPQLGAFFHLDADDRRRAMAAKGAGLVDEDLAKEGEPLLRGERGAAPARVRHELQGPRQLVALRPPKEGTQPVAFVRGVLGDPCVEVRLTAIGQGEGPVGKPGQEAGGVDDLLSGVAPAGGLDGLGLGDAAQVVCVASGHR